MQRALLALWLLALSGCMSGRTALSAGVVCLTVAVVGVWASRRRNRNSLSGVTGTPGSAAGVSHADLTSSGMDPTLRLPQPSEKLPQLLLALEDARARHDVSEECDLLLDLARAYSDAADYPCAVDNLSGCLRQSAQHSDEMFVGQAHLEAAYVHLRAKQTERAVQACEAALKYAEQRQNRALAMLALDRMTDVWVLSGRLPEAIATAKRRLTATDESPESQVPARLRVAELLLLARSFDESNRYFTSALAAAHKTGQEHDESRVTARLARAAVIQGDPRWAIELVSARLEQVVSWSEMFDSARVLSVLGEAYLELGMVDKAVTALARHRTLLHHQNDDRVRLLANLTLAYRKSGLTAEAAACYRECDSLSTKLRSATLPTVVAQSTACLEGGEAQSAMFCAQLALDLGRSREQPDGESWALWALARAQLRLGQTQRATAGLSQALEKLSTPKDKRLESLIHEVLAEALTKLEQTAAAEASRSIRAAYLTSIAKGQAAAPNPAPHSGPREPHG